jgi:hypothetical protein
VDVFVATEGRIMRLSAEQDRRSYLARHWRGELSLGKSFWANDILFSSMVLFIILVSTRFIFERFRLEPSIAVALIVSMRCIAISSLVWAFVGLWRSARAYEGPRIWSVLARVVTALWLGGISLGAIISSQTLITTYINCTTGRDIGDLATLFAPVGSCEVAWYPKHGLVVRRLWRGPTGNYMDIFDQ